MLNLTIFYILLIIASPFIASGNGDDFSKLVITLISGMILYWGYQFLKRVFSVEKDDSSEDDSSSDSGNSVSYDHGYSSGSDGIGVGLGDMDYFPTLAPLTSDIFQKWKVEGLTLWNEVVSKEFIQALNQITLSNMVDYLEHDRELLYSFIFHPKLLAFFETAVDISPYLYVSLLTATCIFFQQGLVRFEAHRTIFMKLETTKNALFYQQGDNLGELVNRLHDILCSLSMKIANSPELQEYISQYLEH